MKASKRWMFWLGAVFLATMLVFGCTTLSKDSKSKSTAPEPVARTDKNAPKYLDFADILIPGEMKIDRDQTYIVKSQGFTAGILTLEARVDIASLITFFENNMKKDNWELISEFKSPRTMMLYHKENRVCLLDITEGTYYTNAKIWVAPMRSGLDAGLLK